MNDVFGFVSLIVLGCGIYTLYAYIKMKKTGEINEILLLGNAYYLLGTRVHNRFILLLERWCYSSCHDHQ